MGGIKAEKDAADEYGHYLLFERAQLPEPHRHNHPAEASGKAARYPMVGDLRGMGMMRGLEFVRNKGSKDSFDPELHVYRKVYDAAFERGLVLWPPVC